MHDENYVDTDSAAAYTLAVNPDESFCGDAEMSDYAKYRSMMHHLLLIDEEIRSGKYPNAPKLARMLELAPRTIGRKIEFMRDVLRAPLAYDSSRKGYYYSQKNWSLPNIRITEGELLGLAMAQMALHAYQGTPLENYLKDVSEKIQAAMPDKVEVRPTELSDVFRFRLGPVANIDPAIWEQLAGAIRNQRSVEMTYYNMTSDKTVERSIDPYLLRCHQGDWYLIGKDRKSGYIPMFLVARIRKLKVTKNEFEMKAGFCPDEYLGGTFGVFESKDRHKVKIKFTGFAARYIPERTWHPSQKLTKQKDGSIILEMTLADIDEIGRWIMTWGKDAKVLGPKELAEFVKEWASEIGTLY